MAKRRARGGDEGFALIEALVSLVIVAMISLMLVQGLGTGRRVWERIDRGEAAGETVEGAQNALRDRIEEVYPATLYDKNPPYVDFDGAAGAMSFLSSPPWSARPAALMRYRLEVTTGGELMLSSLSDVAAQGASVSRQALLTGVRQLDLAYFGAADPDQTRRWRSSWQDQPTSPELVRVRVVFEPGDRRWWPDLIVHPQVTIDTACVLEPVGHRCRGRA